MLFIFFQNFLSPVLRINVCWLEDGEKAEGREREREGKERKEGREGSKKAMEGGRERGKGETNPTAWLLLQEAITGIC